MQTHFRTASLGDHVPACPPYVRRFAREQVPTEDYSFLHVARAAWPQINASASQGLQLWYGSRALAVIGYEWQPHKDLGPVPHVTQLQARKSGDEAPEHPLAALRWERMLLEALVNAASNAQCRAVTVQPAEQNAWYEFRYWEDTGHYKDSVEDHHLRMRIRYNVTAQRCGFVHDPALDVFVKHL